MLIRGTTSRGYGGLEHVGLSDDEYFNFHPSGDDPAPMAISDPAPAAPYTGPFELTPTTSADFSAAQSMPVTTNDPVSTGGGSPDIFETSDAAANTSTIYTLSIGQTAQGNLSSGDHDFYRVNLVAGQTYTFGLTGTGTNNVVDTYLRLYSSNGTTQLSFNDDGLQNNNSILTYTAGTTGAFYIDASGFDSSDVGQYGVSVTAGTRASFDLYMGAGVIDTDQSWSATPGTGATVTYGFRQTTNGSSPNFSQLSATEMVAAQAALQFWHDVAGINFTQVNPGGYTDNASILIANYNADDDRGAYAYYPGSTVNTSIDGDVWLNTLYVSTSSLPFGSYSFQTILHELGHAIGLSHPGLYNAGSGVSITYANSAQFVQDSLQYSVMSYFDASATGGNDGGYPDTPMMLDVYALQQIYGANTTTRTGNTVYGFSSNAGTVYDFSQNTSPAFCIWDAGGTDELNCGGYSQSQTINLGAGTFSNVGGLTYNISIALGATIENADGGSGSDFIYGNSANNAIRGGLGNDTMDGGGGIDTAVFSGLRSAYTITSLGGGNVRVAGPDGTDTLSNFEFLQFSDQTVSTTANTPPVATIGDHSLHTTTWSQVAGWISYSDADGNPAVSYQFVDQGSAAGSAQFWTPSGYLAAGDTLTVAATDLANVWVGGSSLTGSETMYVRAFDGTDWSAWDPFTLTSTNTAPVAAISDHSQHTTAWTQASSWVSYSDANSDAATMYQFVDLGSTAGSGQFWTPSTGYLSPGATLTVAATDLANVWIGGATTTGSETMYVRAFDGADWSAWDPFTLTSTNTAPVATINDHSLVVGQWAQVQNWLSYSDANGDAATMYQFVDQGTAAGSGQFWTPAGGYLAPGPTLTVAAADLANVWVGGANNTGTDAMWVRAFDGASWSAWDSFTFTATANHAPTATIADHSVVLNQWTQAQNWLSYSDADGNAATMYQFVDQGTGAGSGQFWTPAGYLTAGPTPLTVAAADLPNVWVGGATTASTDAMWVRAYDGHDWSSWDPFTLTSHA
jgi:hypothetical protein